MSESRNLRDEDVRTACMAHLSILEAEFGVDIPYRDGLDRGFPFRGKRVPFLSHMKGIYRSDSRGPCSTVNSDFVEVAVRRRGSRRRFPVRLAGRRPRSIR